jgi:uncharacterized membrane protein
VRLRAVQAVLAVAGFVIAVYLTWAHYTDSAVVCTTGGCETVQRSSYSELAGVPVALLGALAYAALIGLAAVPAAWARSASFTVALVGVAFSGYLLWAQAARIHAYCQWCLTSDAIMVGLAVVTALAVAREPHALEPA